MRCKQGRFLFEYILLLISFSSFATMLKHIVCWLVNHIEFIVCVGKLRKAAACRKLMDMILILRIDWHIHLLTFGSDKLHLRCDLFP